MFLKAVPHQTADNKALPRNSKRSRTKPNENAAYEGKAGIKAAKIYLVADILYWAVVGASHVFDKFHKDPDIGVVDCLDEIWNETYDRLSGK